MSVKLPYLFSNGNYDILPHKFKKGVAMLKTVTASLIALMVLFSPVSASAGQASKKGMKNSSPFLITSGLPHYTMILKKRWDDPKLALTPKQKVELLKIRKATLGSVIPLKKEVIKLQREIVKAAMKGAKPEGLSSKVDKLAELKAKATKIHLECIYDTKNTLTPTQLKYLHSVIFRKK